MITLTYSGATATLSDRLIWTDEYAWSPVVTETRTGTNGALHVHVGKRLAGRPITLDGRDSSAWITRALCNQLQAWAAIPGATFDLVLRGVPHIVMFTEFQAAPIWRLVDGEHTADLQYVPFFKFIEV
ncbi:hypothetical protein BA022_15945 [Diaphorobacter nitroreducens]|uniref:hypothetical protein n=1 Tax=Diaphorobacter TaxID=238749 RepID=UPI000B5A18CC|nr:MULTISPECIES: hypothetical protein [Diaphorobacter]ASI69910.1 hypothetical protein BA022_15945 [Diaphorobacter nitroreducens]